MFDLERIGRQFHPADEASAGKPGVTAFGVWPWVPGNTEGVVQEVILLWNHVRATHICSRVYGAGGMALCRFRLGLHAVKGRSFERYVVDARAATGRTYPDRLSGRQDLNSYGPELRL